MMMFANGEELFISKMAKIGEDT